MFVAVQDSCTYAGTKLCLNDHYFCDGAFTPEQDNDKTNVEPVHFYYAFHTRSDKPGVKGIIEMHRFNFCLVVVLLWCESTMRRSV